MGAVAFQKGLGAIHSLSHPIGAVYNTHHGTTNAVVMLDLDRPGQDRVLHGGSDFVASPRVSADSSIG